MAYKNHPPKSRRYKRSSSHSHHHEDKDVKNVQSVEPVPTPVPETIRLAEKKNSSPFGFLSTFLGSGEKAERSGNPLIKIFDHDIYLDDLLLVGLIFLLLTEKNNDEILLIVLIYLLADIF